MSLRFRCVEGIIAKSIVATMSLAGGGAPQLMPVYAHGPFGLKRIPCARILGNRRQGGKRTRLRPFRLEIVGTRLTRRCGYATRHLPTVAMQTVSANAQWESGVKVPMSSCHRSVSNGASTRCRAIANQPALGVLFRGFASGDCWTA
jgi:hypothetical protein